MRLIVRLTPAWSSRERAIRPSVLAQVSPVDVEQWFTPDCVGLAVFGSKLVEAQLHETFHREQGS